MFRQRPQKKNVLLVADRYKKRVSYAVLGVCIAFFIGICTFRIAYPGVQYDEILFANIALGANADHFVIRILGIPLFTMPYLGALKAYLYYPIFGVFGVAP